MKFSDESRFILLENLCCTDYITLADDIGKLESEIERLNNIINDFEDWLNTKYEERQDIWYVKVLNKLQEFKGGNNNENN